MRLLAAAVIPARLVAEVQPRRPRAPRIVASLRSGSAQAARQCLFESAAQALASRLRWTASQVLRAVGCEFFDWRRSRPAVRLEGQSTQRTGDSRCRYASLTLRSPTSVRFRLLWPFLVLSCHPRGHCARTCAPTDEMRREDCRAQQLVRQHEQPHHRSGLDKAAHRHSQPPPVAGQGIDAFGRGRALLVACCLYISLASTLAMRRRHSSGLRLRRSWTCSTMGPS